MDRATVFRARDYCSKDMTTLVVMRARQFVVGAVAAAVTSPCAKRMPEPANVAPGTPHITWVLMYGDRNSAARLQCDCRGRLEATGRSRIVSGPGAVNGHDETAVSDRTTLEGLTQFAFLVAARVPANDWNDATSEIEYA